MTAAPSVPAPTGLLSHLATHPVPEEEVSVPPSSSTVACPWRCGWGASSSSSTGSPRQTLRRPGPMHSSSG